MQIPRNDTELIEIVSQGESQTLELKATLPPSGVLARELAAFANARGGLLMVGVKDDGSVVGLTKEEADVTVNRIGVIGESLFQRLPPIEVLDHDGRRVVCVLIHPPSDSSVPVLTAKGELYVREGNAVRLLTEAEEHVALHPGVRQLRQRTIPCTVFVAMSFREEEEPALVDYYRGMERAVKHTNLPITLKRVDLIEGDYDIARRLMAEIESADIVIADFTLNSRNVYFELGYARGIKKRVIQTARKGEVLEFDIRNWRTIEYRNATELEDRLVPEIIAAYAEITRSKR